MKSLKIGLIALALATGVTAFATSSKTNDLDPCTNQDINIQCPLGATECCIAQQEVSQRDGMGGFVTTQEGDVVFKSTEQ